MFRNISKTTQYFILVVLHPLGRVFTTFSMKKSKKFSVFFLFSTIFFSDFYPFFERKNHGFWEYLENYSIFYPSCLAILYKSFWGIFCEKVFFVKKTHCFFPGIFFNFWKNHWFLEISGKLLKNFSSLLRQGWNIMGFSMDVIRRKLFGWGTRGTLFAFCWKK